MPESISNSNYNNTDSSFAKGWALVKACNEALANKSYTTVRVKMAEYFKLGLHGPTKLHSAILSIAVKLGTLCPDFHLVPFLNMWGIENLRPEDSDAVVDATGRRIPSLAERLAKSYAYALLFHNDERLEAEFETHFFPLLQRKGYVGSSGPQVFHLMATRMILKDVRGRKMTFVCLITPDGKEILTEVHTLTAFQHLRYESIPGTVFDALLRTSEGNANKRIEAAVVSKKDIEEIFPTKAGYVERIDQGHGHTHIFDNESRHFVAEHSPVVAKAGDYVAFTPIIPKDSNFKTAIIRRIYSQKDGQEAFGYRKAKVTYTDQTKGFCAWEFLPESDGTVRPLIETGTSEPSFVKGYISKQTADMLNMPLPAPESIINIICFLKRGKDKQKRPHVTGFNIN